MRIITGNSFCYYLMQFANFFVLLSGIALCTSLLFLYLTIKSMNSFLYTIGLIAIFIILTATFGFFCTKNSPNGLLIYQIFLLFLTIFIVILTFFIIFDQEEIIEVLIANMQDSALVIEQTRLSLNNDIELTKMGMFVFACLLVRIFFLN